MSSGQRLLYEDKGGTQIIGYCDADWASCAIDTRSTTKYFVFFRENIVPWKSQKQYVVSQNSAEIEYRYIALTTCVD